MKCKRCNNIIPENSRFCSYCGAKAEKEEENMRHEPTNDIIYKSDFTSASGSTSPYSYTITQKKSAAWKKALCVLPAIIVILIVIGVVFSELDTEPETTLASDPAAVEMSDPAAVEMPEPATGEIIEGTEVYGGSVITVIASDDSSCLVKLKDSSGATRLGFYVRAGETADVGTPAEDLYVYFASGETWYGEDELFGEGTYYSMDDEICKFAEYTFEYTLTESLDGNFAQTPINEDEFN